MSSSDDLINRRLDFSCAHTHRRSKIQLVCVRRGGLRFSYLKEAPMGARDGVMLLKNQNVKNVYAAQAFLLTEDNLSFVMTVF